MEVTPASYGVSIQAFHFWYVMSLLACRRTRRQGEVRIEWTKKEEGYRREETMADASRELTPRSGEGRGDSAGKNLYENFAETGASAIFPISEKILNLADHTSNMENEAKEEEAKDKEIQAEIVRKTSLKKRMGMTGMEKKDSTSGSGSAGGGETKDRVGKGKQLSGVQEDDEEVVVEDGEGGTGVDMDMRGRASEFPSASNIVDKADWVVSDLRL